MKRSDIGKWAAASILALTALPASAEDYGDVLDFFNGIEARSNVGAPKKQPKNWINGIYVGLEWECVEYVRRYYLLTYGRDLAKGATGDAKTFWANAAKMGLARYENNEKVMPEIGDILVSTSGKWGHVAIVSSVRPGEVCTFQQNMPGGPHLCLSLSTANGKVSIGGFLANLPVKGWLRSGQATVAGDFDGDRHGEAAKFDRGRWELPGRAAFGFGVPGDVPLAGDFDGDGFHDIGVFRREANGQTNFYLDLNRDGGKADRTVPFGPYPQDVPVVGDWDGDGDDDLGGYDSAAGKFYLYTLDGTRAVFFKEVPLGWTGDRPLAGDWDGDGRDEVGVFRPRASDTGANFYFDMDLSGGAAEHDLTSFGRPLYAWSGSSPIIGDWDGDGDDNVGLETREGQVRDAGVPNLASAAASLTLTSPAGYPTWRAGTWQLISWNATNLAPSGNLQIFYRPDTSSNWVPITSLPPSSRSLWWAPLQTGWVEVWIGQLTGGQWGAWDSAYVFVN